MYKVTPNPPPLDTAQLLAQASRAANHFEPDTTSSNRYEPLFFDQFSRQHRGLVGKCIRNPDRRQRADL